MTNASGIAITYSSREMLPFLSRPTAVANIERGPSRRRIVRSKIVYASADSSRTTPYSAVGTGANSFSPIQPVTNGVSDSQKSRCRFAHSTAPSIRVVTCSMWWWLFQ